MEYQMVLKWNIKCLIWHISEFHGAFHSYGLTVHIFEKYYYNEKR
jgi:hypothetical protein